MGFAWVYAGEGGCTWEGVRGVGGWRVAAGQEGRPGQLQVAAGARAYQ